MNDDMSPNEPAPETPGEQGVPVRKRILPSDPRWVKEPETEVSRHMLNVLLHFRPPVDLSDGDGDYEEDGASEEDEG